MRRKAAVLQRLGREAQKHQIARIEKRPDAGSEQREPQFPPRQTHRRSGAARGGNARRGAIAKPKCQRRRDAIGAGNGKRQTPVELRHQPIMRHLANGDAERPADDQDAHGGRQFLPGEPILHHFREIDCANHKADAAQNARQRQHPEPRRNCCRRTTKPHHQKPEHEQALVAHVARRIAAWDRKKHARQHEQPDQRANFREAEADLRRDAGRRRAHGLELKPKAGAAEKQQREDGPTPAALIAQTALP